MPTGHKEQRHIMAAEDMVVTLRLRFPLRKTHTFISMWEEQEVDPRKDSMAEDRVVPWN